MHNIFTLLMFVCFVGFFVGLAKPAMALFFLPPDRRSRLRAAATFGVGFFVSGIIGAALTPKEEIERRAAEQKLQADRQVVELAARKAADERATAALLAATKAADERAAAARAAAKAEADQRKAEQDAAAAQRAAAKAQAAPSIEVPPSTGQKSSPNVAVDPIADKPAEAVVAPEAQLKFAAAIVSSREAYSDAENELSAATLYHPPGAEFGQ